MLSERETREARQLFFPVSLAQSRSASQQRFSAMRCDAKLRGDAIESENRMLPFRLNPAIPRKSANRKLKRMVRRLREYWAVWLKERSDEEKLRLLLAIRAGEGVRVATVSERACETRRALSQSHILSRLLRKSSVVQSSSQSNGIAECTHGLRVKRS